MNLFQDDLKKVAQQKLNFNTGTHKSMTMLASTSPPFSPNIWMKETFTISHNFTY
jgi:hypothetical protein